MPIPTIAAFVLMAQIPAIDAPVVQHYSARYADIKTGAGAPAEPGKIYVVHYTLWLPDGKKIDSSLDRGTPLSFEHGKRRVIAGWEAGFEGMRAGGKRRLFIPYQLGYGVKGRGEIPPRSELIFDIELLEVRDPEPLRTATPPPGARFEGISETRPTGSAAILPDNLAASYNGQALTPDGRLRDFSSGGNHGRIAPGGITLPPARAFDADGPLTVAIRLRLGGPRALREVFTCKEKYSLIVGEEGRIRFVDSAGNGFMSFDEIKTGEWHSLVAVVRGTKTDPLTRKSLSVFVDGQELDGRMDPSWQPGKLSEKDACAIGMPPGDLGDLLLFGRALADPEVGAFSTRAPR
jgi:peptidylprolyl isomerase